MQNKQGLGREELAETSDHRPPAPAPSRSSGSPSRSQYRSGWHWGSAWLFFPSSDTSLPSTGWKSEDERPVRRGPGPARPSPSSFCPRVGSLWFPSGRCCCRSRSSSRRGRGGPGGGSRAARHRSNLRRPRGETADARVTHAVPASTGGTGGRAARGAQGPARGRGLRGRTHPR